jgi:hypothetical protein
MTIPFMVAFSVISVSVLMQFIKKRSNPLHALDSKKLWQEKGIPLLIFLVVAMYSFLLNATVSPLKCNYSGNYVMYDNPSKFCFDEEWWSNFGVVIFFFIIYGIGLPSVLIFLFWRNRTKVSTDQFGNSFGSITDAFQPAYFWWKLVIVFKRTCFAIMNVFLKLLSTEDSALFFTACLVLTFHFAEVAVQPYKRHSNLLTSIL